MLFVDELLHIIATLKLKLCVVAHVLLFVDELLHIKRYCDDEDIADKYNGCVFFF